ncbi:MAG: Protein YqeV [Candidatus Roizmanbacteria bacterium GW2011_GWA2_33_33]|uniref:Protein YqeV n=2 Tax=Candidatus Roizmaniibacteriota TaxID=1752723 RepID=A0A0G0DE34_9BACT|nr:MAG: Protein YqeV [Candidatus Roizmanbacteria bacterium GW2011_GWA2_33_33]KKP61530.1 MAG: Protein YqeV [Candidatus Roizmanbacteria bacterium GW2011_GWC2_34_23]
MIAMKSFYCYSFGCRVNQAEKEVIDGEMQNSGFSLKEQSPNISIINTCAVTHKAEREAKQLIFKLKRENPNGQVVITGCSATYWKKNNLLKNLPVDLVVDNINKEFLVKLIQNRLSGQASSNLGGQNKIGMDKYLNSGRALIKIQDGCQRFCSYCIVPYLRGTPKSAKIKDIVSQINKYPDLQEAILTAINTEAFGFDTGEKLITLIDQTIEVTKIPRISFGSIHPWSINEEFLNYYKKILPLKRLVNFFHVPIQSGSNKILNLMKRGYTREEIMEKLRSIERLNKYALIATDVIVGFLDETDKDFQDTYDFLEKSPISKFHIFRFSNRNNTSAHYMARNLKEPSNGIKMKRAKILAKLGKEKYEKFLKKNVGRTSTVLFLNNKFDGYQEALLDNQLQIYIKVIKPIQLTQLYEAKILEYKKGKLFGRII